MYEENQEAKKAYAKTHAVNRSHGGVGMSREDFEELTEAWKELKYYDFNEKETRTKGFKAKSVGLFVFSKIFRYVENIVKNENDIQISETMWKMNFSI
jgi:hypothetical protein